MVEDLRSSRVRLTRANKLATAGEMASKLAHEVRTPLGIIRSSAQVLERSDDLTEQGKELISFMILECDRINGLVSGLLESTKTRKPDLIHRSLNQIVTQTLTVIAPELAEKSIKLTTELAAADPVISCDVDLITQALRNLVINAYHVLPHNGKIRISTKATAVLVDLRVEDDGPGIALDQRDQVMESFVSFRDGGIGLGLPIVREIVELHRGELTIENSELGGACLRIQLPRVTEEV
jgi:two-component system sensor histidine kinase HydH